MRAALAALLSFAPLAAAGEFEVSVMAGATVPLLSDSGGIVGDSQAGGDTKVSPFVLVSVETPISAFDSGPTLVAGAQYGAGPGESLEIQSPDTYRSLSVRIGLSQPLSRKLYFGLYAEFGFATRFEGDTTPRDRAPRWVGGGLRFKGYASELLLTLNADQRLSSTADVKVGPQAGVTLEYAPTIEIRCKVPIYQAGGKLSGAKVSMYVNAILGMDWSKRSPAMQGGRHDVVLAGVMLGV